MPKRNTQPYWRAMTRLYPLDWGTEFICISLALAVIALVMGLYQYAARLMAG